MARRALTFNLPGLDGTTFAVTSPRTPRYNCIAWALGESHRSWDPSEDSGDYWPENLPADTRIDTFESLFATHGFVRCADGRQEQNVEKIALFADEDGFTHVARQLATGLWTSKLGACEDIEHELTALTAKRSPSRQWDYGRIVGFMMRARATSHK